MFSGNDSFSKILAGSEMLSVLNFLTKKGGNKIDANISKVKSVT